MSLSYVIGNTLVDPDELHSRIRESDKGVIAFGEALRSREANRTDLATDAIVHFSTGSVTLAEFGATSLRDGTTPFQPVGIGKPATIMLRHVYTGRYGKKDMLLTSAVRDPFTSSIWLRAPST